jgi:hypothetical protein
LQPKSRQTKQSCVPKLSAQVVTIPQKKVLLFPDTEIAKYYPTIRHWLLVRLSSEMVKPLGCPEYQTPLDKLFREPTFVILQAKL